MTCKDCVHYEVCMDFTTLKESEFFQNYDKQEDLCNHFKNKADVVVVRCKDCKYYKAQKQSVNWKNKKKYCCRVVALKVNENDYCSYGDAGVSK